LPPGLAARMCFYVNVCLSLVAGVESHRPGKVLGVAERCGAGGDEQLRHLVVVQILPDRDVRRGAEGLE
jgi:hypothetical protein